MKNIIYGLFAISLLTLTSCGPSACEYNKGVKLSKAEGVFGPASVSKIKACAKKYGSRISGDFVYGNTTKFVDGMIRLSGEECDQPWNYGDPQ